ncbi:dynein axonemal intermediate chain 1 [Procambarus clarkii]|uniref:dynein axonemal intermediate chain 1 n=1 Tax=Procambarus clarkii TaxID=6728 RepID=UPI003743FB1C
MMVRLSRILGRDLAGPGKGRPRVIDTRLKSTVKGRQVRLMKKMRTALGKKTKPKKPKKSLVWGKVTMETPIRPSWDLTPDDLEEAETEPEVQINLSCRREYVRSSKVVFCSSSGRYQPLVDRETLLDLLTLPSRVQLREDAHRHRRFYRLPPTSLEDPELEDVMQDSRLELEELYGGVVSKEELARIDSQPNPFSFSERVSQTTRLIVKSVGVQTEPPPGTRFSDTAGFNSITCAYLEDRDEERRHHRQDTRDRPTTTTTVARDPIVLIGTPEPPCRRLLLHLDLPGLATVATVLERMVTQNIYDDIAQDLRYWEDGSDEFHPLLGSLLPLWRFRPDQQCRRLTLADVSWSPIHPDIFAAAYASGGESESAGLLCVFTLKNPATPHRVFRAASGFSTLHFHPQVGRLLAAGRTDGTVMVYDIATTSPTSSCLVHSHTDNGKHLLSVTQVRWTNTSPGEELCFFSVSVDGRVTQWHMDRGGGLVHTDLLDLATHGHSFTTFPALGRRDLGGLATIIAFRPGDESVFLLGMDTGAVFQCSLIGLTHSLTCYPAHTSAVRSVSWNTHHTSIFLTCSLDWTVKVWLQHSLSPLVTLDLGVGVAGAAWSPYTSTVLVAVTEECRVHVYDLFLRQCRPLCLQNLSQRRRVSASCLAFSPFYPVVSVGGDRGHLVLLKLSPNLRKLPRNARDLDASMLREVERSKLERLIATNKG